MSRNMRTYFYAVLGGIGSIPGAFVGALIMGQAEVLSAVRKCGLPVAPHQPIPSGAFDYSGEFKDYAWPTTGLSPFNEKQK